MSLLEVEAYAKMGATDSGWTQWSRWSNCEPNDCVEHMGSKTRRRFCNNYKASKGKSAYSTKIKI